MRNKEILDALSKRANELESNFKNLSAHDVQFLKLMHRICCVLIESEIINISMRIEALLATQGYLVTDMKGSSLEATNDAIAFAWDGVKALTSQAAFAEMLQVNRNRVNKAYLNWLGSSKKIAA